MKRLRSRLAGTVLAILLASGPLQAAELPLTLKDPVTGDRVRIDAGGKALHVVFFATWCPPCRDELENLADSEARWGEQGYRLVLVAVQNRQTQARLAQFAKERRLPGILLFDEDGKIQRDWKAEHIPTHVLFGGNGREVLRTGELNDEFREAIGRLVAPRTGKRGGAP
jgi:peroxiredoxin